MAFRKKCSVGAFGFLFAAALAGAAGIDMAGRRVLLDASADPANPSPALLALKTQPGGALSFSASEADFANDERYALFVGCDTTQPPPTVEMNGQPVRCDAFPTQGGWLYRIHPHSFAMGENLVKVIPADKEPLAIDSMTIFSLVDTFEEVHFNRAFGLPAADKAQPAAHADQAKIDAQHYKIDLTLDMSSRFLTGSVEATVKATVDGVTQVVLDLNSTMSVSSATLLPSTPVTESQSGGRVFVTLPSAIDTGDEVTIRLVYSGTPTTTTHAFGQLGYQRSTAPGVPLLYSFSEPYSAREWWPCKDLPDDKATAEILLTCPNTYEAISNGDLLSIDDMGGGNHRYHWSEGHPLATYLVSLVCTDLVYRAGTYTALDDVTTMDVGHYVWPSGTEDTATPNPAEATVAIMEYLAETFGEYPFLDEKYVTATWGATFGMEHQTATSINDGDLLNVSGGQVNGESRRNIHELSHMWFGDQVTPNDWSHLWLSEGWASYCEALYREHDEGTASYFAVTNGWISSGISNTTALVYANAADDFAGSIVYRRGGFVLHMLRHVMGDTAFFEGARNYLADNAYGTVVTQDLEDAMEAEYGQPLDWFFDEWVYDIGRPTYTWQWGAGAGNSINVLVDQGSNFFEMPIDLHLELSGGGTEIVTVWNDTDPQTFNITPSAGTVVDVTFDPLNWILKNATETVPTSVAAPTIASVRYTGTVGTPTRATVAWTSGGGTTAGFVVQGSRDLATWETIATITSGATTSHEFDYNSLPGALAGGILGTGLHVRVQATSLTELPSAYTDVYSFRPSIEGPSKSFADRVLVVDAYDRTTLPSTNPQPHPWCAYHGHALARFGAPYDNCANELVGSTFDLADYAAVVWVNAEESTTDDSFSTTEQTAVSAYLQGGGKLFVTGAETAWDLDRVSGSLPLPTTSDRAFFNDFLKADWTSNAFDDSSDYDLTGSAGGIFNGMSFQIDDGNDGIYFADFPDYFNLNGGSTQALVYSDLGTRIAGLQFTGTFTGGSAPGQLVYFGFGFETIVGESTREEVMERVMTYFGLTAELPVVMDAFEVH